MEKIKVETDIHYQLGYEEFMKKLKPYLTRRGFHLSSLGIYGSWRKDIPRRLEIADRHCEHVGHIETGFPNCYPIKASEGTANLHVVGNTRLEKVVDKFYQQQETHTDEVGVR